MFEQSYHLRPLPCVHFIALEHDRHHRERKEKSKLPL